MLLCVHHVPIIGSNEHTINTYLASAANTHEQFASLPDTQAEQSDQSDPENPAQDCLIAFADALLFSRRRRQIFKEAALFE